MSRDNHQNDGALLTKREVEVISLVADGLSNQEIADNLVITIHTVKDHLKHIYNKLDVSRRTKAVTRARKLGILTQKQRSKGKKNQLPVSLLPLIGRDTEIEQLTTYLENPDIRLCTIHGQGGIGKTHLAVEVAHQLAPLFDNNVYFLGLEALASSLFFIPALVEAVGFYPPQSGNLKQQFFAYLSERKMLLVLDSCEYMMESLPIIGELLKASSELKILATSRERLNIMGEVIFGLGGVDIPQKMDDYNKVDFDAIQLFLYNAERVSPGFQPSSEELETIVQICQYVEGLPLAILLAASWVNVLSISDILIELRRDASVLDVEGLSTLFQSKSLLKTFSRSLDMLEEHQRNCLLQLSIFRGRFSREAAQAVVDASLPTLSTFIYRSLLQWDPKGKVYYLHSIFRQYGLKMMEEAQQLEGVLENYFDYWHTFAATHPDLSESIKRNTVTEAVKSKDTWEHELEDIRAALRWGIGNGHIEASLELGMNLRPLWSLYGFMQEWFDWLSELLEQAADVPPEFYAQVLFSAGDNAFSVGDHARSRDYLERSINVFKEIGKTDSEKYCMALLKLGDTEQITHHFDKATLWYGEALEASQQISYWKIASLALTGLGLIASDRNDQQEALKYLREGLEYAYQSKNINAICVALVSGEYSEAEGYFQDALQIGIDHDIKNIQTAALANLGDVAYKKGDYEKARQRSIECIQLAHQTAYRVAIAHQLEVLAKIEAAEGSGNIAAVYYGAAKTLRDTIPFPVSEREQDNYQEGIDMIRDLLTEQEFVIAWREGELMPLDSLVAQIAEFED